MRLSQLNGGRSNQNEIGNELIILSPIFLHMYSD